MSFYFQIIMDSVVPGSLKKTLITLSLAVIMLYAFKSILEGFRNHLMLYLSQKIDIPLILGYYNHVLGLPMKFFSTRKVGEIISRFMDASKMLTAILRSLRMMRLRCFVTVLVWLTRTSDQ